MHPSLCLWLMYAFLVLSWARAAFPTIPAVLFDVGQPAMLVIIAVCLLGGL